MATPTRRAASRSAPSSSRSTKTPSRASRPDQGSPTPRKAGDDDFPIDPALLDDEPGDALQDDIDAEGEVDDGVGYYFPVSRVYPSLLKRDQSVAVQ